MRRREFIAAGLAVAAKCALGAAPAGAGVVRRVRPGDAGWPGEGEWAALNAETHGRLQRVTVPKLEGDEAKKLLANPFYIGDEPGLTESSGGLDGWRSAPSAYMVAAESAADVAAAVNFAREHRLRLVVKGRGHSYLGTSCAPDSLLVWTRKMDGVTVHDAFVPAGSKAVPVPAVSVGAGCMWLHAYQAVTGVAGRYVQGGGCTTVGVAGLVQGGGFGSFSKTFGSAAASLLEAEIVTADGKTRVVNSAQEPDLFWALKGGGGGTFGVATRLTLATHELPSNFGVVNFTVKARSDEAFRKLLTRFLELYATALMNPHWGEQVRATPENRLEVKMLFQGLSAQEARAAWQPLVDSARARSADYEVQDALVVIPLPAKLFWSAQFHRMLGSATAQFDSRPGASRNDFWWTGNTEEAGAFWYAYTSVWMPASLLKAENRAKLVDAWFEASRHWGVSFHFNKGLAGASPEVIEATRNTAMNPDVLDAFALAIVAADAPAAFEGLPGPDLAKGRDRRARVQSAIAALRAAAPETGTYFNECDYFQPHWQNAFWGTNYPRLVGIKRRYDPEGLFYVHHGVGSEEWTDNGFTRLS